MSNLLLIVMFQIFNPTTQSCDPPVDVKTTVVDDVDNKASLKLTWKPPTTGTEVEYYHIFVNGLHFKTSELSYLIGNPLPKLYTIDVISHCRNEPDSSGVTVEKGFVGEPVYASAGEQSVKIEWITTATNYDNISIVHYERMMTVFSINRPNNPVFPPDNHYKGRITYTGFLKNGLISFIIRNVTIQDAGYYTSMIKAISTVGQVLVILDKPTKPTIQKKNSYVGKTLALPCDSQKTSMPDYYIPELNYTWFFHESVLVFNASQVDRYSQIQNTLIIDNITRQDKGKNYSCKATERGQQSEQSNIITLNPLYQPELKNITYSVNGGPPKIINAGISVVVSDRDNVTLQCNTEANPQARMLWHQDGKNLKHIPSGDSLAYNLGPSISCETSGIYNCVADNGIPSVLERNISLFVQCKPKQNMLTSIDNLYGSRLNSTENVSVSIFAYPRPLHKWTTNSTGLLKERQVVVINSYSYRYEGLVRIQRSTDFGNYCLDLTNSKGSSVICIKIQSEDIPVAPSSFTVEDTSPQSISLNWISEFRGGDEQTFYLEYREKERYSSFIKINMSDDGRGKLIRVSVKNLKIDVVYVFRLYSRNRFGKSKTQEIKVKTEACPNIVPVSVSSSWIGFYAGVTMVVVVVVIDIAVIVAVAIVVKRHKRPLGSMPPVQQTFSNPISVEQTTDSLENKVPQNVEDDGDYWYSEIKESENNDTFVAGMNKGSERSKSECAVEMNEDGYLTAIDIEDKKQTVKRQKRKFNRTVRLNDPKESGHDYINV